MWSMFQNLAKIGHFYTLSFARYIILFNVWHIITTYMDASILEPSRNPYSRYHHSWEFEKNKYKLSSVTAFVILPAVTKPTRTLIMMEQASFPELDSSTSV